MGHTLWSHVPKEHENLAEAPTYGVFYRVLYLEGFLIYTLYAFFSIKGGTATYSRQEKKQITPTE